MKTGTLVCTIIFLGLLMLQEANGGKKVDDKKLNSWSDKTRRDNKNKTEKYEFKNDSKLVKEGDNVEDLIEVIQYVITNAFNNQEFRTFMIKRFLHNYVSQVSEYLKEIKKLKMKMDPKAAAQDDKINKAMNV